MVLDDRSKRATEDLVRSDGDATVDGDSSVSASAVKAASKAHGGDAKKDSVKASSRQAPATTSDSTPKPAMSDLEASEHAIRAAEARLARTDVTPMQKHASFFDTDDDGFVSMLDTYRGCRAMGVGVILSALAMLVIGLGISWATRDHPFQALWRFDIKNAARSKHGSDIGVYDREGHVDEDRFDRFWQRWDPDGTGYLTWPTIWKRIRTDHDVLDLYGMSASVFEWGFLYWVAAEKGKGLSRDAAHKSYDGTIFLELQKRYHRQRVDAAKASESSSSRDKRTN